MLARAVLFSPARVLASQARTRYGANPDLLRGLAAQRGDYIVGVILVLTAFAVQITALLSAWDAPITAVGAAVAMTIASTILLLSIGGSLSGVLAARNYRLAGEALTRERILQCLQNQRIDRAAADGIIQCQATFIPSLAPATTESRHAHVRRIARHLGIVIPDEAKWFDLDE
jgi:hypothetical protein